MIGKAIAHYDIVEKLGEGGMGLVFKARDRRLERFVALKVLPSEKLTDNESNQRFAREAKAASALNHANIVIIYEINVADGTQYIAMEYVHGSDLFQLIRDRKLSLPDAIKYAVQISGALAAAHEAGIIHRDLKPANIMINDKGVVKVLDFGLAKLSRPIEPQDLSNVTPTVSMRVDEGPRTQNGTVIGTAAYMSPEQATGNVLDARTDIFSFGAVLYEMVTGRRAFRGESVISTLSAVLREEPEAVSLVLPGAPRELERIVHRCLKKDREYRFQHMDDVRIALLELQDEMYSGKVVVSSPEMVTFTGRPEALKSLSPAEAAELISQLTTIAAPQLRSRKRLWIAGSSALILLLAGALALWQPAVFRSANSEEPAPAVRLTSDPGLSTDPALSPDGKVVVYASDHTGQGNLTLWMRQVAGGEPVRLTSGAADDHQPCFSPDGTRVAFRSDRDGGGVYVLSSLGGEPRLAAKYGRNPRYSPDGKQLVYWVGDQQAAASLYVAPANGGTGKEIRFQPGLQARFPVWSPDGKYLLFVARESRTGGTYDWWVAPAEGGAATRIGAFELLAQHGIRTSYSISPGVWAGDRIYFTAGVSTRSAQSMVGQNIVNPNDATNLWQISISGAHKAVGRPRRLTFGTGLDAAFSLTPGGELVFATLAGNVNVWSLPATTSQGKVTGPPQRLTEGAATDSYPSISADGRRMVFFSDRSGNADIWLKQLDTGAESRLTFDPAFETFPIIAPDGGTVAYAAIDDPKFPSIHMMKLEPGASPGPSQKVCSSCGNLSDLSGDGRVLYYNDPTSGIISLDTATGARAQIARRENRNPADPRFSPDGKWVAFHTIVSALTRQIVIAPAPGLAADAEWLAVTDGKTMDRLAAWAPDGSALYFISEADGYRCIAARRLDPVTKRPVGPVFYVYHFHGARRSLMNFTNVNMARLSIARDRIVFSLGEHHGNLWLTKLK
jgi:serine/threonine protein kinase/Tol biopolymer transport system component